MAAVLENDTDGKSSEGTSHASGSPKDGGKKSKDGSKTNSPAGERKDAAKDSTDALSNLPPIVKRAPPELRRSESDPLIYPTDSRGLPRKRKSLSRLVDPNFYALKDNPAYKTSSLTQRKLAGPNSLPLLRRNGSDPLRTVKRRQSHNSVLRFRDNGSDGSPTSLTLQSPLVTGRRASHFSPRTASSRSRSKGSIHYTDLFRPKTRSLSDAASGEEARTKPRTIQPDTLAPEQVQELYEINEKFQIGERKIIKLRQWNKEIEQLTKERTDLVDVVKNLRAQVSQLEAQIVLMKEKEGIFQNQILRLSTMMMEAQARGVVDPKKSVAAVEMESRASLDVNAAVSLASNPQGPTPATLPTDLEIGCFGSPRSQRRARAAAASRLKGLTLLDDKP